MTYLVDDAVKQPLQTFKRFDADTQLALLWYGYLDIKEQLTPAPTYSAENMGTTVFDHIKALSKEEQLQAMRDLANKKDTSIGRGYAAISPNAKMEVWLKLSQGMENGTIIGFPQDYELPSKTNDFVEMIKGLDFEQRINFTRNAVEDMGFDAAS